MRRYFMILGLGAAVVLAGVLAWRLAPPGGPRPGVSSTPSVPISLGGPFTLVDHNAKTVTDADFRGRVLLVFFGYTFCPDVCPTAMQTVSEALDLLGAKADRVQPLFISVDPARDTPEVLKSFVENFHPRLIGLTGSPGQVKAAAKAYKVYFEKGKQMNIANEDYLMSHTAAIYLMGADGAFITLFSHGATAEKIAAGARKVL